MRQTYTKRNQYSLTRPPKALVKARLENIAIVPASMLPLTETVQRLLNNLPQEGVFLCHVAENTRQKQVLERAGEVFRQHGHAVRSMSLEQVVNL